MPRALIIVDFQNDFTPKNTALDALRAGLRVHIDERAVRGIDPDDSRAALDELRQAGAVVG